ncbi:MAG TPA: VCBS repeat-containing protein [Kofleriaceae bacterium]
MRNALLALVCAASTACTDFAPVERGICGNGLLEAGEDCDSSDATCVRCAVSCSSNADCPSADYACGVDGLCHAPGGVLGQPHAAGTFQASELHVTDIDHDGIGDVLGLSRTSIIVRHGEATAQLATLDSIVTPTQTGPAAFGDLDGDGTLDLALTTADGLVSYASRYGELAPVAVNSGLTEETTGEPLDLRRFFHIAPLAFAGFLVDPATDNLFVIAIDGSGAGTPVFAAPCAARLGAIKSSAFDPTTIDVYNIGTDPDEQLDTIVSFVVNGATRRQCVLALHRAKPQILQTYPAITVTDITPAAFGMLAKRPVLADLDTDTDPCPGIVRTDGGPNALAYFDGSRPSTTAPCGFAATATPLPPMGAPPTADVIGRVPVVPSVLLVASDGLVTTEGLYPYLPTGIPILSPSPQFSLVYRTTRKIALVDHGDLDGDGNIDAVLAAAGEEDLDLLFRAEGEAGFNLVRVDTASTVTHLTVGDYDANHIADVAYGERFGDFERLMVAFGTPDRPLAPTSMGTFPGILSLTKMGFPDSVDYLNLADDLIVIAPPASGSTTLRMSLLHGSPQRTLLSYFDPRPDSARNDTLFRGAVIGHFLTGSSPDHTDMVAIAPPTAAAVGMPGKDAVKAWRIPGTADGLDATATPGVSIDGIADCSLDRTGKLCLDLARYIPFSTGLNHDVVIGIDRSNAAVMIDPWAQTMSATVLDKLTGVIPAGTTVRSLHAADLDGDDAPELIAAFAPTVTASRGAVIVCKMQNGIAQSCEDLVPAIVAAGALSGTTVDRCVDAAPVRLSYRDSTSTADRSLDLAVVCHGDGTSLFRVRGDVIERLATSGAVLNTLRAGDVTGDHVDDLVLLEGDTVTSLVVYPQCTSRDASTCRSTAEEVSP